VHVRVPGARRIGEQADQDDQRAARAALKASGSAR
jgi:hypothetical protein